jgi:hypothetical protein
MPPDVRKRCALPSESYMVWALRPDKSGVAHSRSRSFPEGRRPSAHQAAQPQTLEQSESNNSFII